MGILGWRWCETPPFPIPHFSENALRTAKDDIVGAKGKAERGCHAG